MSGKNNIMQIIFSTPSNQNKTKMITPEYEQCHFLVFVQITDMIGLLRMMTRVTLICYIRHTINTKSINVNTVKPPYGDTSLF